MEKMIIPRFKYLMSLAAVLCLTACESKLLSKLGVSDPTSLFESVDMPGLPGSHEAQDKMVVNRVEFSKDHKNFSVWTGIVQDIGPYPLTDSSVVRIQVEEYNNGVKTSARELPKLVKAWNTEMDRVKATGVKVLVLVDLSLPQQQIDAEHDAVKEMLTVLDPSQLYLAFMSDKTVTPSRPVSDYILGSYFKKEADRKLLYRSALTKIQELASAQGPWDDAKQVKLIVFSDGQVYDNDDMPYDSEHFKMENNLLHSLSGKSVKKNFLSVYYINFGQADADDDSEADNVFSTVCETSGGAYLPSFNWTMLETGMFGAEVRTVESNRFDFVNPDGTVYRGGDRELKLHFIAVKDKKLLATATAKIHEGSFYKPIIVNGAPLREVIMEGISVGLFLLLALYLILQFLVPYIQYRLFLKKYVIRYTGQKMAIGDIAVAESCYLCKAPFKEGDEVVVKCHHTLHKQCWDENEYHCPEFGRHCKDGSHFYDKEHLLDKRNAPFYLKWLLMAIFMGTIAWLAFISYTNQAHAHILQDLIPAGHAYSELFNLHLNPLPSYGFLLAFFLTLGISLLAFRRIRWTEYLDIFLRALIAGAASAILFLLVSLACIALRLEGAAFLINLIPWALSSLITAQISTHGSRIELKRSVILIVVGIAMVSMLLWSLLYMQIGIDFRVLLLYSTLIYMIGMALAIATAAPKSEHYFLHIEGAVKTMDVALYKWFRYNPHAMVSIGKSVDCSLQLSWDLQGNVAPVHVQIYLQKGAPRLKALEPGVKVNGRELKPGQTAKLYHGTSFSIANTLFTYQETDI